ncbi:MAG: hypothetical protein JO122_00065 [Acetobacteraceae bacterium]|nr:hypothetical protein [Acetobacteraceae bacterium]
MTEILPGFAVGELERPAALRRRAACLRESAETCKEDTLRASLLDTASDLEAEAKLLEYEAIQLR